MKAKRKSAVDSINKAYDASATQASWTGGGMWSSRHILGGRAAVLLALLDGPARAVTLHDRIRARVGKLLAVTDGACRKALACLERDGLVAPLILVGASAGFELTPAGNLQAEALRSAALALARPMSPVKIVETHTSRTA